MKDHFTDQTLWRPLESILESWLNMIHNGKIVAMSEEDCNTQTERLPAQDPWVKMPYSETILDEAVDTFNKLVQAIESRMPIAPDTTKEETTMGLIDEDVLEAMHLAPGFLYSFLHRARRPNFCFIAPGFSIPGSSSFADQPFWSQPVTPAPNDDEFPPILLFTTPHPYTSPDLHTKPETGSWTSLLKASWHIYSHAPSLSTAIRGIYQHYNREVEKSKIDPNHPFYYPFSKTHTYSAGLYISPGDTEDEVKLLLPAHVEGDGFARRSDGAEARLGEGVYGIGFTPFAGWRGPSLLDVLTHWLRMVESGAWRVDEKGVGGGIETWRDADIEATAGAYVLPIPSY